MWRGHWPLLFKEFHLPQKEELRLFTPYPFTKHCHTMAQANDVAKEADNTIRKEAAVLYGKVDKNGKLIELSEEQKEGDYVVLFGFGLRYLKDLTPHK